MTETSEPTRQVAILEFLKEHTTASIGAISEAFHVSEMTIRRDLQKLADAGHIIRIPRGARIERWQGMERSFVERLQKMSPAKNRIGEVAAALVQDGESVVLDSGTTTLYIARRLRTRRNVVVFTFSIAVLEELATADSVRVELTGGVYRASSHDLIGHAVGQYLASICADYVIFGAAAVSLSRGVMVHDPDAQREMLQAGKKRVLVVDSSKIGAEATYRLCGVEECDLILTDSSIRPQDLARLRQMTTVQIVDDTEI